jgi:hypothetical protein
LSFRIAEEVAHYGAVTVLCSTGEFSAIEYLYSRLGILDAKTTGLLSVNAILAAAETLLVFHDSAGARGASLSGWGATLWIAAFALLIISSGLCVSILYLRFDRITEDRSPPVSGTRPLNCTCTQTLCELTCEYHCALLFMRNFPKVKWRATPWAPRTLADYKRRFFVLTMARERAYRRALLLMALSAAITAALVLKMVVPMLFPSAKSS